MRKVVLSIILLFLIVLVSCSQSQTESASTLPVSPIRTSTLHVISTSRPIPDTPISFTPIPYPASTQLFEAPISRINPYPPPRQEIIITPSPTFTSSPSPTIVKPTPTFPASLMSLRIAYTAKGKLWLWTIEKTLPLTEVEDTTYHVSISDGGKVIAFSRESGLWAINSDGTGERLLIGADDFKKMEPTNPGVELAGMDWIPNTHTLVFNTRIKTGYGLSYTDDLHMVNADTKNHKVLLPPTKGGQFIPSPDGKLLAIVTPSEIRLMNVDGSNYHTVLRYPNVAIPSEYAYYADPVWASDSKSLMVAIPPNDVHYDTTSPTFIWYLPIDGQDAKVISAIEAERGQYVSISPDLLKIAILRIYKQKYSSDTTYELHIANIDGSNDKLNSDCKGTFIGWAQDSEGFMCRIGNSYYLVRLDSKFIFLTNNGLLFSWLSSSNFLYLYGYSGFDEIRLGFIGEPSITLIGPEDRHIYYDFTK